MSASPRHMAASVSRPDPQEPHGSRAMRILCVALVLAALFLTWAQLEVSNAWHNDAWQFLGYELKYQVLNVATLGAVWLVLYALAGRVWVASLLLALAGTVLAVVNYYTILYHNCPASFLELKNAGTALNVLGGYTFQLDERVWLVIALFGVQALFVLIQALLVERRAGWGKRTWAKAAVAVAASCATFYVGYFSPWPVKPAHVYQSAWTSDVYYKYGYVACTVETFDLFLHPVKVPEGFDEDALASIEQPVTAAATRQPDIVLILNETFADLSLVCDYEVDEPYLEHISALDNTIVGHAVMPHIGGSTNGSEWTLLTGNGIYGLQPSITPFNFLDVQGAYGIASVLKGQGYATTAEHPRDARNYARDVAYPGLGFDTVHFAEDYEGVTFYGERPFETDACVYDNLVRWREETVAAAGQACPPQFVYCLTVQNHGEWDTNDPSYDTVHATGDFGAYGQEVNEFLSCVDLSDEAFAQLCARLESSERPTIVCMLGDHMPSFVSYIADGARYTTEELDLRERSTPFVIWANFDIEDADLGYVSANYLAPLLLDVAGAESSPYFAYQRELMERYPVLTGYGTYYDAAGTRHTYGSDPEHAITDYYYLEYACLEKLGDQSWYTVR